MTYTGGVVAIQRFIAESNSIEGIRRAPSEDEHMAHMLFLSQSTLTVDTLEKFVALIEPLAILRRRYGLDVIVGSHEPPPGGHIIEISLQILLDNINEGRRDPWQAHCEYETLHPFTDGNGRSGRAIWAWQMLRRPGPGIDRGFLHEWYYQTLENSDTRKGENDGR